MKTITVQLADIPDQGGFVLAFGKIEFRVNMAGIRLANGVGVTWKSLVQGLLA